MKHWIGPGLEERRRRHAWEERCGPIRSMIRSHADATEIRCIVHELSLNQTSKRLRRLRKLCSRMDGRSIGTCQECRQGMEVVMMNYSPMPFGDSSIIDITCNECHFKKKLCLIKTLSRSLMISSRDQFPDMTTIRHTTPHNTTTNHKPQKIRWKRRS